MTLSNTNFITRYLFLLVFSIPLLIHSDDVDASKFYEDDERILNAVSKISIIYLNAKVFDQTCDTDTASNDFVTEYDYWLRHQTNANITEWDTYFEENYPDIGEKTLSFKRDTHCTTKMKTRLERLLETEIQTLVDVLKKAEPGAGQYVYDLRPFSDKDASLIVEEKMTHWTQLPIHDIYHLAIAIGGEMYDYSYDRYASIDTSLVDPLKAIEMLEYLTGKTSNPYFLFASGVLASQLSIEQGIKKIKEASTEGDSDALLWVAYYKECQQQKSTEITTRIEILDSIKSKHPEYSERIDRLKNSTNIIDIFSQKEADGCSRPISDYIPLVSSLKSKI